MNLAHSVRMALNRNQSCFLTAAALASAFLFACQSPESQVVGAWKIDADATRAANSGNRIVANQIGRIAATVKLEFKSDKSFHLTLLQPFDGTYKMSGRDVAMAVTKVGDTAVPKEKLANAALTAKLDSSGKLTVKDSQPHTAPLVFIRS